MNEIINSNAIEDMLKLFIAATCLIIFWIIETFWRNKDRGALLIFIFPPIIIYYIIKYWEETRAKLFFAILLIIIILFIGSLTDYSFSERIFTLFGKASIWPYYLYQTVKNLF